MKLTKLVFVCFLLHLFSCQSMQESKVLSSISWNRMSTVIVSENKKINQFDKQGPFSYKIVENYIINLSPENSLTTDLFLPNINDKSPLVVMVHGNKFNKGVHRQQGERLASWGFHVVTVGVPNEGQWIKNGFSVFTLVNILHEFPELISKDFNTDKIVLIGHSFGGSAVTIAAGNNKLVTGLILLDPAVVHNKVKKYMTQVSAPVILLGADPDVFASRKRKSFYKNIAGPMAEVTVTGATHNDAQLPSITEINWGIDPFTTDAHQEVFLQAMIAGAFSLTRDKGVNYAWDAFQPYVKNGLLKTAKMRDRKKFAEKTQ